MIAPSTSLKALASTVFVVLCTTHLFGQATGDEWFELLGKNFADRSVQPSIVQFTEERTPLGRTDNRMQICWFESGISMLVTERGEIHAIFFKNNGYVLQEKEFSAFKGQLPLRLSMDMSLADIEKTLGTPTEKDLGQVYGRVFYRTNYDITFFLKDKRIEYLRISLIGK